MRPLTQNIFYASAVATVSKVATASFFKIIVLLYSTGQMLVQAQASISTRVEHVTYSVYACMH